MQEFLREKRLQVFVPDDSMVWLSAQVISEVSTGQYEIEIDDIDFVPSSTNKKIRILRTSKKVSLESLPLQNVGVSETGVDDMCSLNYLHEASVLDNLRRRFRNQLPYTYTGNICIAINPYQWLDIYSDQLRNIYMKKMKHELPPHVYSTSANAYKGLRDYQRNQSILVSGESGAGKTETVKILMRHLAQISGRKDDQTILKVLQANPLLESFGNAKTLRNDNSSRFGKFTQLQFDEFSFLCGSRCVTYLLEKCRVVSQNTNERNYHIFHQYFAAPEDFKAQYFLTGKNAQDFTYTSGGDIWLHQIEGVSDGERFSQTIETLDLLGVSEIQRTQLHQIISGILHLGEVRFQGDADSSLLDPSQAEEVNVVCGLLGIEPEAFAHATTTRNIEAGGKKMQVSLSQEQASESREALAKDVYARLFLWLVRVVNDSTSTHDFRASQRTVSLLDIFGFESFDINRFEQLCINYANEKLQQKFTQDMFLIVQQEYQEEGLRWEQIAYNDNQETIDLFEGRLGLLALLNEECLVPKGTDLNFLSKFASNSSKHPSFSKSALMTKQEFCIHHFAGKVTYHVDGFLVRNKDTLPVELKDIMTNSSNHLVVEIFMIDPQFTDDVSSIRASGRSRRQSFMKAETVTTKFKSQLISLMEIIGLTDVQYVRCVKPNAIKSSKVYDRPMVVEQLRCAGMIEAIRISRAAYPYRVTHEEFAARFSALKAAQLKKQGKLTALQKCQFLLQHLIHSTSSKTYDLGKTKVYFSSGVLEILEGLRGKQIFLYILTIQRCYRGYVQRKRYLTFRRHVIVCQKEIRRSLARKKYQKILSAANLVQRIVRMHLACKRVAFIRWTFHVTRIQSWYRMIPCRRYFCKLKKAVTKISAFIKMKQAQSRFVVKLQHARQQKLLAFQVETLKQQLEEEINARANLLTEQRIECELKFERQFQQTQNDMRNEFDGIISSLKFSNDELKHDLNQAQVKCDTLIVENNILNEKNLSLHQLSISQSTECDSLKSELEYLKINSNNLVAQLENQNNALLEEVSNLKLQVSHLEIEKTDSLSHQSQLSLELSSVKDRSTQLERELQQKIAEHNILEAKVVEMKHSEKECFSSLRAFSSQHLKHLMEIEDRGHKLEEMNVKITTSQTQLKVTQAKLQTFLQEKRTLESQLSTLQSSHTDLLLQHHTLEENLKQEKIIHESLKSQHEKTKELLTQSTSALGDLQTTYHDLQLKHDQLNTSHQSNSTTLDSLLKSSHNLGSQLEKLENELHTSNSRNTQLENQNNALLEEVSNLKLQVSHLEIEKTDSLSHQSQLSLELSSVKYRSTQLERELQQKIAEHNILEAKVVEMKHSESQSHQSSIQIESQLEKLENELRGLSEMLGTSITTNPSPFLPSHPLINSLHQHMVTSTQQFASEIFALKNENNDLQHQQKQLEQNLTIELREREKENLELKADLQSLTVKYTEIEDQKSKENSLSVSQLKGLEDKHSLLSNENHDLKELLKNYQQVQDSSPGFDLKGGDWGADQDDIPSIVSAVKSEKNEFSIEPSSPNQFGFRRDPFATPMSTKRESSFIKHTISPSRNPASLSPAPITQQQQQKPPLLSFPDISRFQEMEKQVKILDSEKDKWSRMVSQLKHEKSHIMANLLDRSQEIDELTDKLNKYKKRIRLEKQMRTEQFERFEEVLQNHNLDYLLPELDSPFILNDNASRVSDLESERTTSPIQAQRTGPKSQSGSTTKASSTISEWTEISIRDASRIHHTEKKNSHAPLSNSKTSAPHPKISKKK